MEGNQESEKETEAGQERQPSLEEMFARLDEILNNMEDPDISLEDAFSLYEQGMKGTEYGSQRKDNRAYQRGRRYHYEISSGRGGVSEDGHGSNELQLSGRWKTSAPNADVGDVSSVWRQLQSN